MLWSPNVYVLLLARLLNGFVIGLAVTLVPLYTSETAPSEIRGLLNTLLPQFTGSGGMFLAYFFFLPESPRWLVSKGKMLEAKRVLQRLRGREDVSDELGEDQEPTADRGAIKLYGPEEGLSWIAMPVTEQSRLSMASRQGSMVTTNVPLPREASGDGEHAVPQLRSLLLTTIPVLLISLIALVIGNVFYFGEVIHAVVSTVCVVIYFCTFVMGYGPIPNILCSEIFPTRVRGICISICALVFWICDVIVTYTLPVMLTSIGLAGVFGIYVVVSWIFIFLRVPETKGMPLEVITEFFAVGAKQGVAKNE
ncbi:hypothetical protein SASPL_134579 [Salvia splendens]|uniref:Major facilitator superfamily (MFS) profile domain-containing protein n=1 Tax=Salvia splendens TaxID=180675 RepID=A0A8X8ZEX1_SALSN|nr:hypothetical protein SASPL_134579 [Salvia splendens]